MYEQEEDYMDEGDDTEEISENQDPNDTKASLRPMLSRSLDNLESGRSTAEINESFDCKSMDYFESHGIDETFSPRRSLLAGSSLDRPHANEYREQARFRKAGE